jgi:hypothetical protein
MFIGTFRYAAPELLFGDPLFRTCLAIEHGRTSRRRESRQRARDNSLHGRRARRHPISRVRGAGCGAWAHAAGASPLCVSSAYFCRLRTCSGIHERVRVRQVLHTVGDDVGRGCHGLAGKPNRQDPPGAQGMGRRFGSRKRHPACRRLHVPSFSPFFRLQFLLRADRVFRPGCRCCSSRTNRVFHGGASIRRPTRDCGRLGTRLSFVGGAPIVPPSTCTVGYSTFTGTSPTRCRPEGRCHSRQPVSAFSPPFQSRVPRETARA